MRGFDDDTRGIGERVRECKNKGKRERERKQVTGAKEKKDKGSLGRVEES